MLRSLYDSQGSSLTGYSGYSGYSGSVPPPAAVTPQYIVSQGIWVQRWRPVAAPEDLPGAPPSVNPAAYTLHAQDAQCMPGRLHAWP